MKDIRIVFMGTPDFAVAILDRILKDGYTVVSVITAPDKPAGRGRKLSQSAVKKYALSNNLPVLQPTNLKNNLFIEELKSLHANLQIVVAFRMLPKVVWSLPEYGTFNLHASLLPDYRGAAPIHWAIINGEKKTGVTTFFLDEKIDTGEMILKKELTINEDETVGELHDRLMLLGAEVVSETIQIIVKGRVLTTQQPSSETKTAPKLHSENTRIDWDASLEDIYNHIRGLNPFPAAWTEILNGDEVINAKIYGIRKKTTSHDFPLKSIVITKKEIKVAVKEGFIYLDEIKLSGKKKLSAQNLLNGFSFHSEAKMR